MISKLDNESDFLQLSDEDTDCESEIREFCEPNIENLPQLNLTDKKVECSSGKKT